MFALAFFASFPLLAITTTFSLVSASSLRVQTSPSSCPWNGVPNADNFTLLAVSKTDNGTRQPLALGSNGQPSSSDGSLAWLGSAESIGSDSIIAKYFVMTEGEITAYGPDGSLDVVGVSNHVANNSGQLTFFRPDQGATGYASKTYCELFNTSPHGVEFPFTLALNGGDSELFSLCQSTTSNVFIVIYNAVGPNATDPAYKPETCAAVYVHILPVGHP